MKKPEPEIGQIVKYDYLWRDEKDKGRIEGAKERPCAVVVARKASADGSFEVLLAPITHSPPIAGKAATAIPEQAKKITGLDQNRSWLLIAEVNAVAWSDPGIVPAKKGEWLYGNLPRGVASKAVQDLARLQGQGKLQIIDRRPKVFQTAHQGKDRNGDRGR